MFYLLLSSLVLTVLFLRSYTFQLFLVQHLKDIKTPFVARLLCFIRNKSGRQLVASLVASPFPPSQQHINNETVKCYRIASLEQLRLAYTGVISDMDAYDKLKRVAWQTDNQIRSPFDADRDEKVFYLDTFVDLKLASLPTTLPVSNLDTLSKSAANMVVYGQQQPSNPGLLVTAISHHSGLGRIPGEPLATLVKSHGQYLKVESASVLLDDWQRHLELLLSRLVAKLPELSRDTIARIVSDDSGQYAVRCVTEILRLNPIREFIYFSANSQTFIVVPAFFLHNEAKFPDANEFDADHWLDPARSERYIGLLTGIKSNQQPFACLAIKVAAIFLRKICLVAPP